MHVTLEQARESSNARGHCLGKRGDLKPGCCDCVRSFCSVLNSSQVQCTGRRLGPVTHTRRRDRTLPAEGEPGPAKSMVRVGADSFSILHHYAVCRAHVRMYTCEESRWGTSISNMTTSTFEAPIGARRMVDQPTDKILASKLIGVSEGQGVANLANLANRLSLIYTRNTQKRGKGKDMSRTT